MKSASKTPPRFSNLRVILPLTVAMLGVVAFAYAAVQQAYRQGANDPQVELAGDIAAQMSAGSLPQDAVDLYSLKVDPSTSLATFATIVDSDGNVTASNMDMGGSVPLPPKGVLNAASVTHQNRITWQPETGTRIALVVQAYKHDNNSGYVLVGRSLKEVEAREDMVLWMAIVTATGVALLGMFASLAAGKK